jgi:hypothetical protein
MEEPQELNQPFAGVDSLCGYPMAIVEYSGEYCLSGDACEEPRSLAELKIMNIAGAMRDKPGCWRKISNDDIVTRWRQEALQGASDVAYRTRQFEYALKENQWLAAHFPGPSRPAAVNRVFARDNVDGQLMHSLVEKRLRSYAHDRLLVQKTKIVTLVRHKW